MKRNFVSTLVGARLLLGFGTGTALAESTGTKVKVKGEVVGLWCLLEGGDHGPEHKDCAIAWAKAGRPLGLLTGKGELYLMMGTQDHQPGRDVLFDEVVQIVTLEDTLAKKGGAQAVHPSLVK